MRTAPHCSNEAMLKIKSKKIIVGENTVDGFLYVNGDKIAEVANKDYACEAEIDYGDKYVAAGFIETHTHGGGGYAFTQSSASDVAAGCDFHLRHGVTSVAPTVSAGPFAVMQKAVEDIACAKRQKLSRANILGAHLEGPYLSPLQCGAQCTAYITAPVETEYTRLIRAHGNDIVRWTYAPERDTDGKFCACLTEHGILASAGHTAATYADMLTAAANGCKLVTHLYSCTSTVTRQNGFRRLGVTETAFLRDDLYAELIADGKHLPPELFTMVYKIKGADRVILTTDSLQIAGTDVKSGTMSGTDFIVEDGVCKLKDRSAFAGSVATADALVRFAHEACGLPVATAVKMLTETPAKCLGRKIGRLKKGYPADIVVFDEHIRVSDVYVGGRKIEL